jgi:hypothetical protein
VKVLTVRQAVCCDARIVFCIAPYTIAPMKKKVSSGTFFWRLLTLFNLISDMGFRCIGGMYS